MILLILPWFFRTLSVEARAAAKADGKMFNKRWKMKQDNRRL